MLGAFCLTVLESHVSIEADLVLSLKKTGSQSNVIVAHLGVLVV